MNDRELDAEFERIIAGWDEEATDPQLGVEPVAERAPESQDDAETQVRGDASPTPGDAASDVTSAGLTLSIAPTTAHVWRGSPARADGDDVAEETEETDSGEDHFEPPTLDDLPTAEDDPMFWAIVAGLGGGPLLLLYLLIFDRDGSGWWVATALAMTVVGFVLLVLRGGNERDPFDDGTRV